MKIFKPFFYFFVCICFSISAIGQTKVDVAHGEPLKPEKNAEFSSILGVDEESFYIMRIKTRGVGTKYFVEGFDKKTYAQKFSVDLALDAVEGAQTDPAKFTVNSIATSGKVYVFFRAYYKDSKEKVLFLKSIDKNGVVSKEKEVMKLNAESYEGNFYLTISPDRSKLALISAIDHEGTPQDVTVCLYNAKTFDQMRKFKLPKGYGRGGIYSGNYIIDNPGNLYFSFNYLTPNDKVGLALGSIPFNSSDLKASEINLGDKKELYNGLIKFNTHDNSVTVAGMFKDVVIWEGKAKDKPEKMAGIFSYKIGIEKFNIIKKTEKYLTGKVYDKLDYAQGLVTKAPGDKFYSAEEILEIGNANYFVACHSYAITGDVNYNVSRELIVTKINNAGEIEWTKIIPKFTSFKSTSFNAMVFNDKLHFLFLEHPKNTEKFPSVEEYEPLAYKAVSGLEGPNAVCISVDANGKTEKNNFYKNEGFCYVPPSQNYLLNDKNGLLIRFVKGNAEMFGSVTIK